MTYLSYDFSVLPEVIDLYRVRRRTVWQIVDHDLLMILVTEGSCRITMDHEDYTLTEGTLFLVPPGHHYVRRPVGNTMCTMYYAHLRLHTDAANDHAETADDAEAFSAMEEQKRCHARSAIPGTDAGEERIFPCRFYIPVCSDCGADGEQFRQRFEEAIAVRIRNRAESGIQTAYLLTQLLMTAAVKALEAVPAKEEPEDGMPVPSRKLQKVMAYIRLHSKENITLEELCNVSNFSRQHLIRIFRREFGMTPKAYVSLYRVNCAKELLFRDRTLTVKEVAEEMGFEDQHYFSRLFVRVTGQTPSAYRLHLQTFDEKKQ